MGDTELGKIRIRPGGSVLLPENGNWDSFPKGLGKEGAGRGGCGGQGVPPVPQARLPLERFVSLLCQILKDRSDLTWRSSSVGMASKIILRVVIAWFATRCPFLPLQARSNCG